MCPAITARQFLQASQLPSHLRRKTNTFVFAAALVVLLIPSEKKAYCEAVPRVPNIIFIMADDLGYGHLGCYGQKKIKTPQLDRLAAEGMRFTQAYAGAPVCAPSRSVLLTGLHAGHTPVRGNSGGVPLADDDVTVAEVLKAAGYATGCFGKWGLGEHGTTGVPYKQGFDEFFGYLHQIHAHFYYPSYLWNRDKKHPLPGNEGTSGTQYTHDEIMAAAEGFIRRHKDEPFFLYVPLTIPHYELLVPEDSLAEYRGKFPEKPYPGRGRKPGYPRDYAAQATPKAATAAMITRMDRSIGQMMKLLAELKLDEKTIVIFTSDNGPTRGASDPEFFGAAGPLRGSKGNLYEGGIRVPAIARWPGKIKPGTVSDHVWHFADVMPTLAELGGGKVPAEIDGLSIVPTLLGEKAAARPQKKHGHLFWEYKGRRAVRMADFKALRHKNVQKTELFDLATDPGEKQDISAAHPEVMAKMKTLLDSSRTPPRPQIEPKRPPGRKYQ